MGANAEAPVVSHDLIASRFLFSPRAVATFMSYPHVCIIDDECERKDGPRRNDCSSDLSKELRQFSLGEHLHAPRGADSCSLCSLSSPAGVSAAAVALGGCAAACRTKQLQHPGEGLLRPNYNERRCGELMVFLSAVSGPADAAVGGLKSRPIFSSSSLVSNVGKLRIIFSCISNAEHASPPLYTQTNSQKEQQNLSSIHHRRAGSPGLARIV